MNLASFTLKSVTPSHSMINALSRKDENWYDVSVKAGDSANGVVPLGNHELRGRREPP